jgi:tetratricopeptide (TPR) repeat protein
LKSRNLVVGVLAAALLGLASPAYAQVGAVRGKVVDEKGTPVPDADIVFTFVGEIRVRHTGKTDKNGQFTRAGLNASGGLWTITVTKGPLTGTMRNIDIPLQAVKTLEEIVLRAPEGADGTLGAPDAASAAASAEYQKQLAELKQLSADIDSAMGAKDYDTAISKLNEVLGKNAACKACYLMLGDAYVKKEKPSDAETAYKKAVEIDPALAEGYEALVVLYNQQKRYDEATKTSAKVAELRSAAGGGVADPTSLYNQGVLLWNQGKIAESRAQFEKAIKAKPDLAEAYYYIGMAIINEGKDMAAAGKMLQEYVRLAPQGPHAAEANAMIPDLK